MQRDDAYMLDMLVAARRAAQHAIALEPQQFESSLLHQDAIMRELQIVGEAASQVSDHTKSKHTEIDWNGIIGLRHRLVHDYRKIRLNVVWRVLKNEVPVLIQQLEKIVPPEET
jgi:uncharacterized protein with HEPN domain